MPLVVTLTLDAAQLRAALDPQAQDQVQAPNQAPNQARVSRHLSKRFFDLLTDRECAICYDQIRTVDDFSLRLCGHFFHRTCWERADRERCAVCNT